MNINIYELFQNRNFLIALAFWELIWKAFALWKAAKADHKAFFALILIFNTVGLLPISYLIYSWIREKKAIQLNVNTGNKQ